MKIAFCFLLTNFVKFPELWQEFFKRNGKHYNIYSHIKDMDSPRIPQYIKDRVVKTVKTKWCGVSLISAYINMLKEALKDKENEFFILVSGDCVPLYTFRSIREDLLRDSRARLEITEMYSDVLGKYDYVSQWNILNRKVAKDYINMKKYYKDLEYTLYYGHCPDELYPVQYFKDIYGEDFNKYIANRTVTYTEWTYGDEGHPDTFNKSVKKAPFCRSGALFSRKFEDYDAARKVFKKCRRSVKK